MMPGQHGLGHAQRPRGRRPATVHSAGLEEELGDREVGHRRACRRGGPVRRRGRASAGGPRGGRPPRSRTPPPRARARPGRPRGEAHRRPRSGSSAGRRRGPSGSRPRPRGTRSRISAQLLAAVAHADQVRHGREVALALDPRDQVEGALARRRARRGRSPRRTTGRAARARAASCASARASSSVFGGKNSKERVRPAASSVSMRTRLAGSAEVVLEADDVVLPEVGPVLDLDEDHRRRRRGSRSGAPGPGRCRSSRPGPARTPARRAPPSARPLTMNQCSARWAWCW